MALSDKERELLRRNIRRLRELSIRVARMPIATPRLKEAGMPGKKHKAEAVFYHQAAADLFHLRAKMLASESVWENITDVELGKQYYDDRGRIVCTLSANAENVSRDDFWRFVCAVSNHITFALRRWAS